MAIGDKKQLKTFIEQNDLVKEQISLIKEVNKLLQEQEDSSFALEKNIKKTVESLIKEASYEEQIVINKNLQKKLSKEIKNLTDLDVFAGKEIYKAKKIGNLADRRKYELERKSIRNQIETLSKIKETGKLIEKNAKFLEPYQKQTLNLLRKTEIAQALGFSKYTSQLSSIFNKMTYFHGQNTKSAAALLGFFNKWYYPLIASWTVLSNIVDLFKELDKLAFDSRKEFGMMREEHGLLRNQAENLYKQYAHLGVTADIVYKTQKAISMELGSALSSTDGIASQISLMASQFGIVEGTSIAFLKTLSQIGRTTAEAQLGMLGFAKIMSNASAVPLPQVMEDIAKASETTRSMMSRTPLELIKAAVEARRLATTLDRMTSGGRKLLDFTSSIEAEMEASVMLGRPINLQLARQLYYNGKILESNKEILRIAKQINFEQLDMLTKEKVASAFGRSVDDVLSMLQASREQNKIQTTANNLAKSGNLILQDRLKLIDKINKENEATAKLLGENENLITKQRENQARLTSISNSWKRILMEIGQVFLPIIDKTLKIIVDIMNNELVVGALKWGGIITTIVGSLAIVGSVGKTIYSVFSSILGKTTWIWKSMGGIGGSLKLILARVSGVLLAFEGGWQIGKLLNKLETVQMFVKAWFQQIFSWWYSLSDISTKVWDGIIDGIKTSWDSLKEKIGFTGKWIWDDIKSTTNSIYEELKEPFVSVWNFLSDTFFGKSPSKLGLLIVEGISSIGSILYDALTFPFKKSWDIIKSTFSNLGSVITDGISSVSSALLKRMTDMGPELFNVITSPFKRAWNFVSKLFGRKEISQPSIGKQAMNQKIETIDIPMDRELTDNEIQSYRELSKNKTPEIIGPPAPNSAIINTENMIDSMEKTFGDILNELKGLRNDMNSGKIAVNMDSQLVSVAINRNNRYRGNYGAMSE